MLYYLDHSLGNKHKMIEKSNVSRQKMWPNAMKGENGKICD